MKLNYFSLLGYASVVLWLVVPVLWTLHARRRPRRWLCHVALGVAVLAYVLAKINSASYVNQIQPDQSAEIAEAQAKAEMLRKAADQDKNDGAAKIRFAEDAATDALDMGGLDAADRKSLDKSPGSATPEWKQHVKQRSGADSAADPATPSGKTSAPTLASPPKPTRPPLVMKEADLAMANRLDGLNLKLIRLLIWVGLGFVIVDYLRRVNSYAEAYLPLPLPRAWLEALAPLPPVRVRPTPGRRSVPEELAWLVRRGESFVYFTDDAAAAERVPAVLHRLPRRGLPVDVIRVGTGDEDVDDEFIFETLWYGRSSFVISSAGRAEQLLAYFLDRMQQRRVCRAKTVQTVHLVWDCATPLDEAWRAKFTKLAEATGFSLLVCRDR